MGNERLKNFLLADELNPLTIDLITNQYGSFHFYLFSPEWEKKWSDQSEMPLRQPLPCNAMTTANFIFRFFESNEFSGAGNAVEMRDAHLSWNIGESEKKLQVNHLEIPKKSLVAVVGEVGSGKSSFLSAILGNYLKSFRPA